MNNKIIFTKSISALFLAIVLVTGTIAISSSSSFITAYAQVQPYSDGIDYNNNYKTSKDNSKNVNVNKIKCINDNVNVNGVNAGNISIGNKGQVPTTANAEEGNLGANSYGDGEGYYDGYGNNKKQGKGFDDCVINNNNTNTNVVSIGGGGNVTIPPEPTTPATLTVKKQVFGCDNIGGPTMNRMDCQELENDSPEWLNCNNNPAISGTVFCQSLPESIFDIEVLDDQNTQIQQFQGSEQGTTIQNLEPGTYTVNEIKHLSTADQLGEGSTAEEACINNQGFPDGGNLDNTTADILYDICFEYEDEQGNDCSTITLAAGEERTCTVKNYINGALVLF